VKIILIKFSVLLYLVFLVMSCNNSSDCQMTENRSVKMVFAEIANNKLIDSTVNEIYVRNLNDIVFYKWEAGSKISLPLSQKDDSSLFIISTDSINYDTIIFHYHTKLTLVSSDCGFNTSFYSLKLDSTYTRHKIDTIITLQTNVGADVDRNYRIVLKPNIINKVTITLKKLNPKIKTRFHTGIIMNLPFQDYYLKYGYPNFEMLKSGMIKKRKTPAFIKFFA
jgi:Family of unknown function (DUF6452)